MDTYSILCLACAAKPGVTKFQLAGRDRCGAEAEAETETEAKATAKAKAEADLWQS